MSTVSVRSWPVAVRSPVERKLRRRSSSGVRPTVLGDLVHVALDARRWFGVRRSRGRLRGAGGWWPWLWRGRGGAGQW